MNNCELDARAAPRFPDPSKQIQQVTQLPRNRIRVAARHLVRHSQIRRIGLLIISGFAGGVTGGVLALVEHHVQQDIDNSSTLAVDETQTAPAPRPSPSPVTAVVGGRVPATSELTRRARLRNVELAPPGIAMDQEEPGRRRVEFYGFRQGKFGRKAREKSREEDN